MFKLTVPNLFSRRLSLIRIEHLAKMILGGPAETLPKRLEESGRSVLG